MTVLLTMSIIICFLGLALLLISRLDEKRKTASLVIKVGILLLILCSYLITKDYKFILLFMTLTFIDFFLSLIFLSEKIKGEEL